MPSIEGGATIDKIDLASLPGLVDASALYGAISDQRGAYDDSVVAIMVYVYETVPPGTGSMGGM